MVNRDDWRARYQLDDGPAYGTSRLGAARVVMGLASLAAGALAVALLMALL